MEVVHVRGRIHKQHMQGTYFQTVLYFVTCFEIIRWYSQNASGSDFCTYIYVYTIEFYSVILNVQIKI